MTLLISAAYTPKVVIPLVFQPHSMVSISSSTLRVKNVKASSVRLAFSLHTKGRHGLQWILKAADETPNDYERSNISVGSEVLTNSKKLKLIDHKPRKQKFVLKFVWFEKYLALGLDQIVSPFGPVPLTPYYFWPKTNAWEKLKEALESKRWISRKQIIILLNQATDLINLWQEYRSHE